VSEGMTPEQRAIQEKREALREIDERRIEKRVDERSEPELIFDPAFGKFVPSRRHPHFSFVPRRPASFAVLSMVFAMLVAIFAFLKLDFNFNAQTRLFGANIDHAIRVVLCGTVFGLLVIPFIRHRRRLLDGLFLLEGATLSTAIVLVGLDGATYKARITCTFLCFNHFPPYISTHRLWFLYLLWSLSLVVLLLQTHRVLRLRR
jgi:hypothetical protein